MKILYKESSIDVNKLINECFNEFEKSNKHEKINQISGFKYNLLEKNERGEVIRFFLDDNLEASISKLSKIKVKRTYSFKDMNKHDLLIIGFCLEGQIAIINEERQIIKEREIFYFRPVEDFKIELLEHNFLYYLIDLKSFEEFKVIRDSQQLCCRNLNNLGCDLCIDSICKKGRIKLERAPYVIHSYIEDIRKIKNKEINSFLDYVEIKGKLFNYLTWFVKLRLNNNPAIEGRRCGLYHVNRAKKIIIDNLDKSITVKEIAEKLDISTYRLQKCFKKVEETTVYDFIRKVKIENSKILLRKSNSSIIDISQKIGYENPSKFSATFKSLTGFTPSEYRKVKQG